MASLRIHLTARSGGSGPLQSFVSLPLLWFSHKLRERAVPPGVDRAAHLGRSAAHSILAPLARLHDGKVKEAVRIRRGLPGTMPGSDIPEGPFVEVKRTDGSIVKIYLLWRAQPRGGRSLLLRCLCGNACRALYGAKVGYGPRFYEVRRADWRPTAYAARGGGRLAPEHAHVAGIRAARRDRGAINRW